MSMNAARAVDLDEAAVRRFLAAFGDMRALLRRQDRTGPARRPRSPTDEGFSAFARDARVRSEVLAVLTKHGFADVGAWEAAVQAVTTAVAFADPDSGLADMATTVEKARAEIVSDWTLRDDDRRQMLEELDEEMRQFERMRPSPSNVAAVRPFLTELKSIVDTDPE